MTGQETPLTWDHDPFGGVDASSMRDLLKTTPEQRFHWAVGSSNNVRRFVDTVRKTPPPPVFQPDVVLDALHRNGVQFIITGGRAGSLLGSDSVTFDLDICFRLDDANVAALTTALREIDARLRDAPDEPLDSRMLTNGDHLSLVTTGGLLGCAATPAGTHDYLDLVTHSWSFTLNGYDVRVCSLDDLMTLKRAAGTSKDRVELEQLKALKKLIESDGSS